MSKISPRKTLIDKLLSTPGIQQAIGLIEEYSHFYAINSILQLASDGEFGEELRQLVGSDTVESFEKFLSDDVVRIALVDETDEWLEELSLKSGQKIGELWNLSEPASDIIADWIYWQNKSSPARPFYLFLSTDNTEMIDTLKNEILNKNTNLLIGNVIVPNRLYLDVTFLSYSELRDAYQRIIFCRKHLGMVKRDLNVGAPSTIDVGRALKVASLIASGVPFKQAAMTSGFHIYTNDNPSGSSPLFRKYLKLGREIERKLSALEVFLQEFNKT